MSEEVLLLGGFNAFLYSTLMVWASLFGLWLIVSIALACAGVVILWYVVGQITGEDISNTF